MKSILGRKIAGKIMNFFFGLGKCKKKYEKYFQVGKLQEKIRKIIFELEKFRKNLKNNF